MNANPTAFAARLLIIDDVPENIGVLFGLLSDRGYEVLIAEDGISGLETAHIEQPDLILLDVMMPHIDGFEVCRRLKQHPLTAEIPVIFLTALSQIKNKVSGFQLGAVDYITKPLQHEEVLVRVNTHLTLRRLQQQQQQYIQQLQERNAELDAFAHTVAHDLKNPLGIVSGMSEMLCHLYAQNADVLDKAQDIRNASYKMRQIIDALLLLARVSRQAVETQALDMNQIMFNVMQRIKPQLQERGGSLQFPQQWPVALGQAQWIEEVWVNYLSNGLKYGGYPPCLAIGAAADEQYASFWVSDNGEGLSLEAQEQIFTPFTRLHQHAAEEGHGLGLSIVERIIKKLGGHVGVESTEGQGARFFFTLPKQQDATPQLVQLDSTLSVNLPSLPIARTPIRLPTLEVLEKLLTTVRCGDIAGLVQQLETFATEPQLQDFYQVMSKLAQEMQIRQLRIVLENYINS